MIDELLKTLEITVMKSTAEDLEYLSQKSGMSIGEVVDRLTNRTGIEDPAVTSMLILDNFVLLTARLSRDDFVEVAYDLIETLLFAFPPEVMDEIVEEAKKKREEELRKREELTAKEKAATEGFSEGVAEFSQPESRG